MISKRDVQLGKIALQEDMVTKDQINKCLKIKKKLKTKASLGAILVKKGYITKEQLESIVSIHNAQTKARKKKGEDVGSPDDAATSADLTLSADASADTTRDVDDEDDGDKGADEPSKASGESRRSQRRRKAKTGKSTRRRTKEKVAAKAEAEAATATATAEDDEPEAQPEAKVAPETAPDEADDEAEAKAESKADPKKDSKRDPKRGRSARRKKATARRKKVVEEPAPEADEDIASVLRSEEDEPVDHDAPPKDAGSVSGGPSAAEMEQDPNLMEALLASTLEASEDDPEHSSEDISASASMVSDSLVESADMTESADSVKVDRRGKVKKKIIACKECGKKYRIKPKQAGKRFKCRRCEAKVRVPKDYFDEVEEAITEVPTRSKRRKPGRSRSSVRSRRKEKTSKASAAVDEFDLDDDGGSEEAPRPTKARSRRRGRDADADGDEAATATATSYKDLAQQALKEPRVSPTKKKGMTTGNIVQLVSFSLILVGSIGGVVYYQQMQEQAAIAAHQAAVAEEWGEVSKTLEQALGAAQATLEESARQGEGGAYADALIRHARGLEGEVKRGKSAQFVENLNRFDQLIKDKEVTRLRQELLAAGAGQLAALRDLTTQARALEVYEEAAQVDPANIEVWIAYGHELARAHRWDAAFAVCARATEIDKSSAAAWALRGYTYELGDSAAEAVEAYERAAAAEPFAAVLQARALMRSSDLSSAIRVLGEAQKAEAVSADPIKAATVQIALGRCFEVKGDPSKAEAAYKAAVDLVAGSGDQPKGFAWPHIALGELAIAQGQAAKAIPSLKAAVSSGGGASAQLSLGRALLANGQVDEAIAALRLAATTPIGDRSGEPMCAGVPTLEDPLKPFLPQSLARVELGRIFRTTSDPTNSPALELNQAVTLDPWNIIAHAELVITFVEAGQAARVEYNLAVAEELTRSISGGSRLTFEEIPRIKSRASAEVFMALALASQATGKLTRADAAMTLAMEISPQDSTFQLHHARLLLQSNEKAKAKREFEASARNETNLPLYQAAANKLRAAQSSGAKADLQAAQAAFNAVLATVGAHAAALEGRGETHAGLGDAKAANDDLTRAIDLNPYRPSAYAARARLALSELGGKNYSSAAADLTSAMKLESQPSYNRDLARCQLQLNQLNDALTNISAYLTRQPSDKESLLLRATIYEKLGRPQDAERDRKRAE